MKTNKQYKQSMAQLSFAYIGIFVLMIYLTITTHFIN